MTVHGGIGGALVLVLGGCKGPAPTAEAPPADRRLEAASASAGSTTALIRARSTPPSPKDVINAAFESANVPLSVHESCKDIGTESTDETLGRVLAGFAAELDPEKGKNGIVTSVMENPEGWVARFMVQHAADEDVWSWGLEFQFDKDGVLQPSSYGGIGSG